MAGYPSQYTGEQIDEAVGIALNLEDHFVIIKVESSEDSKADLDMMIVPNIYVIDYYENSYDDTLTLKPMTLTITDNGTTIEQTYFSKDKQVYRYYTKSTKKWTDWKVATSSIISVPVSEELKVDTRTLVLRYLEEGYVPSEPNGDISEDGIGGFYSKLAQSPQTKQSIAVKTSTYTEVTE